MPGSGPRLLCLPVSLIKIVLKGTFLQIVFFVIQKVAKPNFEEKILLRQVKQAKLVKKIVEGHSLAFINMHAKL